MEFSSIDPQLRSYQLSLSYHNYAEYIWVYARSIESNLSSTSHIFDQRSEHSTTLPIRPLLEN